MIAEVSKALAAYGKLDTQGRRLFRDELGLVRPQQAAAPRRRRKPNGVAATEAVAPTTTRKTRGRKTSVGTVTPIAEQTEATAR